jgi:hypothetical protein
MRIDQRNAGASVTPAGAATTYIVDRFNVFPSQASKLTAQQNAGSVTPPTGFSNYLGITSSSAYSVLSTDQFNIRQYIEGFNFADLGFGTANAKTITVSFWVYSSLTGTFGGVFANYAFNRCYPFTYSIPTANTWTNISITIAGDTSGTWTGATNSGAAALLFNLGAGSTLSGTAGAWSGTTFTSATGAVSVVGTNGATFYITGVQLEVGSSASNFEVRDIGRELIMCQRYFQKSFSQSVAVAQNTGNYEGTVQYAPTLAGGNYLSVNVTFPVTMRAAPTVTYYSPGAANAKWYNRSLGAASGDAASLLGTTGASGVTIINNPQVAADNLAQVISVHYSATSEL